MSARSGIPKALAEGLAEAINGQSPYVSNLYGSVTNKVTHFDEIQSFPYVSVTPGNEIRDDMPSNLSIVDLTVYIRVFVENEADAQGELEEIISDIEDYLDRNLQIQYEVNTPSGVVTNTTIDNTIESIGTDEGLLSPYALGEISVRIRYEKLRKL